MANLVETPAPSRTGAYVRSIIFGKLAVADRAQAVARARDAGLGNGA
jgi:hypothetical protein